MIRRPGPVPEDPRVRHWGDFFMRSGLARLMTFEEFMRDPEGIVATLTDPDQPPPAAMPALRERVDGLMGYQLRAAA